MRVFRSIIGLAAALTLPSAAVGQSPSPMAGSSATESPPGIAQAVLADDCLAWTRYDAADLLGDDAVPSAVATLPDGAIVIVGWQQGSATSFRPMAWVSTDLVSWDAVPLPGGGDFAGAHDIAAVDGTLHVIGAHQRPGRRSTGLVWSSTDGRTWTDPESIPQAIPAVVASTGTGIAIVGVSQPRPGESSTPTIWTRDTDGAWVASAFGNPGFLDGPFVAMPGGPWLRLATEPGQQDPTTGRLRLWRSDDGAAWSAVGLPKALRDAAFNAVAQGPQPDAAGFLLASSGVEGDRGAIWRSDDGEAWQPVLESALVISALAQGPCGRIAFTSPGVNEQGRFLKTDPLILVSPDGTTWSSTTDEAFVRAAVRDMAVDSSGRAIAVGDYGLVWIGQADMPATDPSPAPSNATGPAADAPAGDRSPEPLSPASTLRAP